MELWSGAGRLDELLDLFPGNQNLAQGAARLQKAPPDQPTHAFCAAIQGLRGLVNVIKEGLNLRHIDAFRGGQLDVVYHSFSVVFHGLDWPCCLFRKSSFQKNQQGFQNLPGSSQNLQNGRNMTINGLIPDVVRG